MPWPPPLSQTAVAAAAGAAWDGPARGMGRDEAGRAGLGLGGDCRCGIGRDEAGGVRSGRRVLGQGGLRWC